MEVRQDPEKCYEYLLNKVGSVVFSQSGAPCPREKQRRVERYETLPGLSCAGLAESFEQTGRRSRHSQALTGSLRRRAWIDGATLRVQPLRW